MTTTEARSILERYGPIEEIYRYKVRNHQHGDPTRQGIYVKYAYWADCRDALRKFNNHISGYKLYMAPSMEPRVRVQADGKQVIRTFNEPRSLMDQKSIYVGGLPDNMTKGELAEYFSDCGNVVEVNVLSKVYNNPDGDVLNTFAFVEFSNAHEAEFALSQDRILDGKKLRIEAKEYSARRPARLVAPNAIVQQNSVRVPELSRNWRGGYSNFTGMSNTGFNTGYNTTGYTHGHPSASAGFDYSRGGMQQFGTPQQQLLPPPGLGFNMGHHMMFNTPPATNTGFLPMNTMIPAGMFSPPSTGMMGHFACPTNATNTDMPFGTGPVPASNTGRYSTMEGGEEGGNGAEEGQY
jgi:hypothetical protein